MNKLARPGGKGQRGLTGIRRRRSSVPRWFELECEQPGGGASEESERKDVGGEGVL